MKIKNILVPLDFSPCSKNALRQAAILAHLWNARLHLLHATHIPSPHIYMGEPIPEIVYTNYEKEIKNVLQSLEQDVPLLKSVEYETMELVSSLIEAINTAIFTKSIDLIVMGSRGSHNMIEKFLGSNATDVIRSVSLPVLIVPSHITSLSINKIGLALEPGTFHDTAKLDYVAKLADLNDAKIEVFFVGKNGEFVDFNRSDYNAYFEIHFKGLEYEYFSIENNHTVNGIMNFAKEHQLDLLVMIPHNHNLTERVLKGSITKQVADKVNIPLLSIHD
ncbi:MAG: universal stress protein [Cyclobacteriaceae bacterium]|nr:universal stress protein [Cyclobacteriaceae bacterium]